MIIETKNSKAKSFSTSEEVGRKYSSVRKTVEPFVPLVIPTRDRSSIKHELQSMHTAWTTGKNQEIEIFIEKDKSDK